ENRLLSRCVDDHFCVKGFKRAVLHLNLDADGSIALEEHSLDRRALIDDRALLRCVFQKKLVELRASHLPGHRALVMIRFEEIKRARLAARGVCELNAVLANEWTLFELLENSHSLKGPVGVGHQRFADVMTREFFPLEEDHGAAFASEYARDAASGGPAAHHDNIKIIFHYCSSTPN